ncbi:hypothetical protein CBL_04390 [Carabus blaptoides fortunei]
MVTLSNPLSSQSMCLPEGGSLVEEPEFYMLDSDKALFNRIWNIAGFPSDQNDQKPEVSRKFINMLANVAPSVIQNVMQDGKMPDFLQKVGAGLLKNSINHLGEMPGFPPQLKPVLPIAASLIPNQISFPSFQNGQQPEVNRKFVDMLSSVAPTIIQNVMPDGKMPDFLQKVGAGLLKNSINQLGEMPGFPPQLKPILPVAASLIPNQISFPSFQNQQRPEVNRKFVDMLSSVAPTIIQNVMPDGKMPDFLQKVGAGLLKNSINQLGEMPGFPAGLKPILPVAASLIPNQIGFPSFQNQQQPEVNRKFVDMLSNVAPTIMQNVMPDGKMPDFLQKVGAGLLKNSINQLGEMPGFPPQLKPILPVAASLIPNQIGFPSFQNQQQPEVSRKFLGMLSKVAPTIIKNVIPKGKMSGYLQNVGAGLLKNSINQIGEIPGFPAMLKPILPVAASLIPDKFGKLIDATGTKHTNNNNLQQSRTGRSYANSPITINHKVLPKPSNSEFVSNRSALYQEKANLGNSERNKNTETNSKYYPTDNLKTSPEDLETVNLGIEQMKRMMQFEDVDENIHNKNKTWNMDTTSTVDLANRNSHMDYMHKKVNNTFNTAGLSETSSSHPRKVSHKGVENRNESNSPSDKSPDTSKYYEILQNNEKIHNVERYKPMMN